MQEISESGPIEGTSAFRSPPGALESAYAGASNRQLFVMRFPTWHKNGTRD